MVLFIRCLHSHRICDHHDDVDDVVNVAVPYRTAQVNGFVLRAELFLELQIAFIVEDVLRPQLIEYLVHLRIRISGVFQLTSVGPPQAQDVASFSHQNRDDVYDRKFQPAQGHAFVIEFQVHQITVQLSGQGRNKDDALQNVVDVGQEDA